MPRDLCRRRLPTSAQSSGAPALRQSPRHLQSAFDFVSGLLKAVSPQLGAGQCRAFDERLELGPLNGLVHADQVPILRKAAIHTGNDVFLADQSREILDAPGDELRMLDD